MSLQDRTEDVRFVDKPTEFSMSEEWRDQWMVFTHLFESLSNKVRPVSFEVRNLANNELSLTDEEIKHLEIVRGDYDGITRSNLRGVHEWGAPCLPINQIRKAFLSFNRRANYEWCFSKAVLFVHDYQQIREELVEYEEHLTLPEIEAPSYDARFVTPFIKQAHLIIQEWLAQRYDHEKNIVKMSPYKVIALEAIEGLRRILIPVDEDESGTWTVENLYNVRTLLDDLTKVRVKYDIETTYASAINAVAGLKNKFNN